MNSSRTTNRELHNREIYVSLNFLNPISNLWSVNKSPDSTERGPFLDPLIKLEENTESGQRQTGRLNAVSRLRFDLVHNWEVPAFEVAKAISKGV